MKIKAQKTQQTTNSLAKQKNSLFFTALSKHAPGAGPPQKKKNKDKELSKR